MKVLGISGWSGCGKTTLIEALIPRLRGRGLTVSPLKHAHHDVNLDTPSKRRSACPPAHRNR
jgi:molybdopterin-guanine dinucleotide biosynthesis protein B